jgi:hypothetical protein
MVSSNPPHQSRGHRISGAHEPPEPMTDEALADAGRVMVAITIERVSAANYIPEAAGGGSA